MTFELKNAGKLKLAAVSVVLAAGLTLAGAASASVLVYADSSGTTDLGLFAAGTYSVTGSGTIDLVGPVGSGFDLDANGVPASLITDPNYSYFNPNGSYVADGNNGPGGPLIKFGALMGSFVAIGPLGNFAAFQPDFFNLGTSSTLVLSNAAHLYAQVNDTYYTNNRGAFDVSVNALAAPEPSAWTLMLIGFGGLGVALRTRRAALSV